MSGNNATMSDSWHKRLGHTLTSMPVRRGRWAVLACIVIICCSLTAAGALQMVLDLAQADARNIAYNQTRAREILASAEDRLSHYEAIGLLFANGGLAEEAAAALPGVRGISVAAEDGQQLRHSGTPLDMPAMAAILRGRRTVIGTGHQIVIVFRAEDRVVAVAFAPDRLLPQTMLHDCALLSPAGALLGGGLHSTEFAAASGKVWPVRVHAAITPAELSGVWGGVPVLFIYMILVPLAAGIWLFWIFRRELVWRAQASLIIRTLRQAWLASQKPGGSGNKRRPT